MKSGIYVCCMLQNLHIFNEQQTTPSFSNNLSAKNSKPHFARTIAESSKRLVGGHGSPLADAAMHAAKDTKNSSARQMSSAKYPKVLACGPSSPSRCGHFGTVTTWRSQRFASNMHAWKVCSGTHLPSESLRCAASNKAWTWGRKV